MVRPVGSACARHRAPPRYTKCACGRTSQITDKGSQPRPPFTLPRLANTSTSTSCSPGDERSAPSPRTSTSHGGSLPGSARFRTPRARLLRPSPLAAPPLPPQAPPPHAMSPEGSDLAYSVAYDFLKKQAHTSGSLGRRPLPLSRCLLPPLAGPQRARGQPGQGAEAYPRGAPGVADGCAAPHLFGRWRQAQGRERRAAPA